MVKSNNALVLSALLMLIVAACAQVSYPENPEADKKKVNLAGRRPLFSPSRCKPFELLYPGDQRDDWICDCEPASLYHPETDACYPAFRQGPCAHAEFLVLGPGQVIPECIPNVCCVDGQIRINNVCYTLGQAAPCKNAHLSYVLGVNATTLLVDCVKLSMAVATRFGSDETTTPPTYDLSTTEVCARGTKRATGGRCPQLK